MIIVMRSGATDSEINHVLEKIKELGLTPDVSRGVHRTLIGVIGEEDQIRVQPLMAVPGVERVVPIMAPYKRASREFRPEDTIVSVGNVRIGGDHVAVIAGPCAVENREMLWEVGRAVRGAGAALLRGGAFKPRTSPYSFRGLGAEALKYLRECGEELGMPVVTEVMDTRDVALVAEYADVLQVGARNMQNFNLLAEVGESGKPVLLKRGMSASVREFLMSAEYILSQGNPNVVLCERGIRTFEDSTRNTLDVSAVPNIQGVSHLPVIVDPSHATGRRDLIVPLSRAAIAAGASGVMVEVHTCPEKALCDGEQALLPDGFLVLMADVRKIVKAMDKQLEGDR